MGEGVPLHNLFASFKLCLIALEGFVPFSDIYQDILTGRCQALKILTPMAFSALLNSEGPKSGNWKSLTKIQRLMYVNPLCSASLLSSLCTLLSITDCHDMRAMNCIDLGPYCTILNRTIFKLVVVYYNQILFYHVL